MEYRPRIVDAELKAALRTSGAVQIKGPKWCGKTASAGQQAASVVYMQDPDQAATNIEMARIKPSLLLEGETPRLIDEWQMAPQLWDAVRFAVDQRGGAPGQFILTGSTVPGEETMHSGVGRIARLVMRPMTLSESGESNRAVSLAALASGAGIDAATSKTDVEELAHIVCRGGWPAAVVRMEGQASLRVAREYVAGLLDSDVTRIDGVNRNAGRMRALMRSYARNTGTQASNSVIAADMAQADSALSPNTLADYLDALRRVFVLDDLEAWNPALRSKTAVRTSPTRHFVDPSIAAALLGAGPEALLGDMETFGFLFESMCVRDLRVYAQAHGAEVYHYRDKTGLEADAVVVWPDGRWGIVEIKLGQHRADEAAANLLKLAARVDQGKLGAPSFALVLTGGNLAYTREDGVHVVPIACLAP